MFEFCQDLNGKAKDAVTKVNMKMLCYRRKSRGEKESVEDFIKRVECQSKGCAGSEEFVPTTGEACGDENWTGYGAPGGGDFLSFDAMDQ